MTAIIFPKEYVVGMETNNDLIIDHRDLKQLKQTDKGQTIITFSSKVDDIKVEAAVLIDLRIWETSCIIADCIRGEVY